MIVTKNIQIKVVMPPDNAYVENELQKLGIEPLRWAITAVENDVLTVTVSYQQ